MLFPSGRGALLQGLFALGAAVFFTSAQGGELVRPGETFRPKIAPASDEGELAMKGFQLQPGFKVELFAAEPHLANPVAFHIDHQNRFWISETFRLHAGVTDIRGKMSWLDEDLAARTADDRLAMMKRHEGERILSYEENSDRVKLILDKDNDGKADESRVFAEGFNHALDGIASGVLARGDDVYFANIPNLWLLRDRNKDGVADERHSLSYGYGVRVGFLGHDLHGLIMGPDGRLYFSIGDRGSNIEIDGKRIGHPDTGSVFRCNPDGSGLEEFAYGLRNPQELAFDQFGNLFTGDNNSDGGDRARLVYLVQGGDSGWRIGWQFLERPNARGPWNSEKMWHPQHEGQPAYIVPPIANMTDGPSGFAFYPGTGLPSKYDQKFFLVDFHGGKGSGIYSFALNPKGAFFELANAEKFVWEALPTDVAFGPEPGLYFTDWVQGWGMTGKGRVYRVVHPEAAADNVARETGRILREGFSQRSNAQLEDMLAHPDMRVRQEAQFELVNRGGRGGAILARTATREKSLLARLHAVWGLGQLARSTTGKEHENYLSVLRRLAGNADPEIKAQSLTALGDARAAAALPEIVSALNDSNERVRVKAALAAGSLGNPAAIPALLSMLERAGNRDPVQRHAASFALARIGDIDEILRAAAHSNPAVRMGVLLALRRLERAEVARFLGDSDPLLVAEAARAINDLPISGAMPELARLADSKSVFAADSDLARRVLNANFRMGARQTAARLAQVAADDSATESLRAEALAHLASWSNPSGRDAITGLWRPTSAPRDGRHAAEAVQPILAGLLQKSPERVQSAAARAAGALEIAAGSELAALAGSEAPAAARLEALRALAALKHDQLPTILEKLQQDPREEVRKEALRLQSQFKPSNALAQIERALRDGTLGEKQSALGTLANLPGDEADRLITRWLDRLLQGGVPPELQLDVITAAGKRHDPEIHSRLQTFVTRAKAQSDLGSFAAALHGGNAAEGRKIFLEKAEASCLRCHKVAGENSEGGGVGPELTGIGAKRTREYLLESIVFPNKHIAEGFETVIVTTKDGTAFAGIVASENERELVINSPEDGEVKIAKANINKRERGLSGMPESLVALLTQEDIRHLVEYLSSLK